LTVHRWLQLLVVAGIALRVGLWIGYEPVSYPDTGTYVAAARDLLDGNLARSEGRRTPGYPLLVALSGFNPRLIMLAQMITGLAISALLFYVSLTITGRPAFAFATGMSYNLNLQQLLLEGALLSETASTLTIVGAIALAGVAYDRLARKRPAIPMLLLLGCIAGAAVLVRPQFVFLLVLLPLLVCIASRSHGIFSRYTMTKAMAVAIPAVLIVAGWCAFVFAKTGYFTLSTQSGMGLVNHSVAFVELAPDRYSTVRKILLEYRAIKLAEQGHYGNTGWLALPEIRRVTGMTLPQTSRVLQRMSVELFIAHPLLYAGSVARGWIDFWTVPIVWEPERIRPRALAAALQAVWFVEHNLLRALNLAFVVLVLAVAVSSRVRRFVAWDFRLTTIAAVVLGSSVIQALADYGANSRYALTVQALVVMVVMIVMLRSWDRSRVTAFTEHPSTTSLPG
jgi:hypothetical protein